jgi:hypothetical protein
MMLHQTREAKKYALLMENLSHQSQLKFLADALEECSQGDSSLSSITSFSSEMTPTHPAMVSMGPRSETTTFFNAG